MNNLATVIIGAVLVIILSLSIRYTIKKKKEGGCIGCNCGCSTKKCDSELSEKCNCGTSK